MSSYTKSLKYKTASFWNNRLKEQGVLVKTKIETKAFIWEFSVYQFGNNKLFRKLETVGKISSICRTKKN